MGSIQPSPRAPFALASRLIAKQSNLISLLAALALGQGITVLVFLFLAWRGQADLVGGFSLGVQIASLSLFFTDFGGAFYLSRLCAARVRGGRTHLPRNELAALLACRLLIAAPTLALILLAAWAPLFNDFTRAFLVAAAPAVLIQSINISGALDGAGRAGVAGLSNTLYFILPTIALLAQALLESPNGFALGAMFSVGVAGAVLAQYVYARVSGRVRLDLPGSIAGMADAVSLDRTRAIAGLFFYAVSGQLLARGQIIIAGFYFPLDTLGAIALAKQIANGASQVVGLFRRIELPKLVQRARAGSALSVIEGINLQKWGTLVALTSAILFLAGAFLPAQLAGDAAPALFLLATHGPAVITTALLAAAMQTCIARHQTGLATISAWSVTVTTLIGVWLVSRSGFAPALFLVEAGVQAVVFVALLAYTIRR